VLLNIVRLAEGNRQYLEGKLWNNTAKARTDQLSNLLRIAAQATESGILIASTSKEALWNNAAFGLLTGWTTDTLTAQNADLLAFFEAGGMTANHMAPVQEAFAHGDFARFEHHFQDKFGQKRWLEFRLSPSLDYRGELTYWVCLVADIETRKAAEREMQRLNDQLQEKNEDITQSIRYAKRIQEALLPGTDVLQRFFDNRHALYYQPKDIVSGDFYWFYHQAPYFYAAVVDCTGHGVPGAFMSVLGANQLNAAVQNQPGIGPAALLEALSDGIVRILRQDQQTLGANTNVKDGMDVALVRLDTQTGQMLYAGANRPAWLLHPDGQIAELPYTRRPAGFDQTHQAAPFVQTPVQAPLGSVLVLFSDGITDQFGHNHRKFSKRALQQWLADNAQTPLDQWPQHLRQTLKDWQASTPQTDDQLLLALGR